MRGFGLSSGLALHSVRRACVPAVGEEQVHRACEAVLAVQISSARVVAVRRRPNGPRERGDGRLGEVSARLCRGGGFDPAAEIGREKHEIRSTKYETITNGPMLVLDLW